jgi:hypothetical protein
MPAVEIWQHTVTPPTFTKGKKKMKLVRTRNTMIFKSDEIASILGFDHYDVKYLIRNIDKTEFGKAYHAIDDYSGDYFIKNYSSDDDVIHMTEEGLWHYLWSLTDPIPAQQLEQLIRYVNVAKEEAYYSGIVKITSLLVKMSRHMTSSIEELNLLQKPKTISDVDDPKHALLEIITKLLSGIAGA